MDNLLHVIGAFLIVHVFLQAEETLRDAIYLTLALLLIKEGVDVLGFGNPEWKDILAGIFGIFLYTVAYRTGRKQ